MKEVANNNFAKTTGTNRDDFRQTRIIDHPIYKVQVLFILFSFDNNFSYDFFEEIENILERQAISDLNRGK